MSMQVKVTFDNMLATVEADGKVINRGRRPVDQAFANNVVAQSEDNDMTCDEVTEGHRRVFNLYESKTR